MWNRVGTLAVLVFSFASGALAQTTRPAEWSRLPPEKWPQLVLTNEATFEGHTRLRGASAFLLKLPDGEIAVGTAKHLIKEPGGVDPPIELAELDAVLKQWRVYPRTRGNEAIEAGGTLMFTEGELRHDWLLLRLAGPDKLPSTPLVPRAEPVKVGEKVFLIGVPYSDHASSQRVYEGIVTARPKPHYFVYEFKPPVEIAGFSGAPIVDVDGFLVGHGVSMSRELKQENGREIEFGGEDASLALKLWRERNNAPTTKPSDAAQITLPEGWAAQAASNRASLLYAKNEDRTAYVQVFAEPKSDFDDDVTLVQFMEQWQIANKESSKLQNRTATEPKSSTIAGRPAVEVHVTGELHGATLRYRLIAVENKGYFVKFVFWTIASQWDANQKVFEDVVGNLK